MPDQFYITGDDSGTVLYSEDSSNGCVMWADRYVRHGDFGGWDYLELWEWSVDGDDALISRLTPPTGEDTRPQWQDVCS